MGTLEIDLHGHTWSEAIQEFIRVYNDAIETVSDLESTPVELNLRCLWGRHFSCGKFNRHV